MRQRVSATGLAVGFCVLTLAGLAVAALFLADNQARQREELRVRYADRAVVARGLLDSVFAVAFGGQAEDVAQKLGGVRVTRAAVDAHLRRGTARWSAVLSPSGRVLAASSNAPTAELQRIDREAYVRRARSPTGFGLGDVTDGLLRSAVSFPVRSGGGRRVLVSAGPAEAFTQFLSGTLAPLPGIREARAYVIDGRERRIAVVAMRTTVPPTTPRLLAAVRARTSGTFQSPTGERFFASQPIAASDWRLILTVPVSALYAGVDGWSLWVPWGVFAVCAVAVMGIVLLLRRLLAIAAALRDANTELGQSNTELARSNEDLEQFAYVASHDLSEPLRTVAGFSTLLSKRYAGRLDASADLYIEHMAAGVDRMQQLIDDLLTYSRLAREPVQVEPVDLEELIGEVLASIDPAIRERGAHVSVGDLPEVLGEPGQLRQVLQNLLVNAVKFTAPGVTPRVRVEAVHERAGWRIDVRDNGIGIPEDQREAVFKMFGRLHPDGRYPGTGIGLALVRRIVERHGGRVWVDGGEDGEGSAFHFTLPDQAPVSDEPVPERIPA